MYDLDYIYSYNNRLNDLYLSEKDKKKLDKYDSNYFKTNSLILFRFYRNKSTESKPEVIKVEVVDDEINVLLGIHGFIINNHTRFELDSVDVPSLPLRILRKKFPKNPVCKTFLSKSRIVNIVYYQLEQ